MIVAGMPVASNEVQMNSYTAKNNGVAEDKQQAVPAAPEKVKVSLDRDKLENMTAEMNKFMEMANAGIHFELHEKTKQLIVQVIDTRDNKVLKEFPPHEMLDMVAKIRDYVGMLLDKRA